MMIFNRTFHRCWIFVLAVAGCVSAAEFAPVFTSGAVLQRDEPVVVWGSGREGEKITVEMLGESASMVVRDGRWQVSLPAMPATATATLRLKGDNPIELPDVAVGEVWIALGQSNMEWRLNQCSPHSDALLAAADQPGIRQLKIPLRPSAGDPLPKFAWKKFDQKSAGQFSAVAYYFAAELHRRLGVTVGIVNCAYGGTPIEAWMSSDAVLKAGGGELLAMHERKAAAFKDTASYELAWQEYQTALKTRNEKTKAGGSAADLGPQPVEPYGFRSKSRPAGLRESMLGIITPYTARGALWYQGENNAGRSGDYQRLLAGLMAELRSTWSKPEWPILIGQLSSPTATFPDDGEEYAVIREAQRAVAVGDPHSGLVVTLDYGERGNVHPIRKQAIGERFARLALARAYNQGGFAAQSPSAIRAVIHNNQLEIHFKDLPGKLELRDPAVPTLEVKSAAGGWQVARAAVSQDKKCLIIELPSGDLQPQMVRYAWRNFCALTLFTDEGLPVSPWSLPVLAR
jgi:sialate O-acetylesterase